MFDTIFPLVFDIEVNLVRDLFTNVKLGYYRVDREELFGYQAMITHLIRTNAITLRTKLETKLLSVCLFKLFG